MDHLHLVIPDLLPPRAAPQNICHGLKLPYLTALLARGRQMDAPVLSLEEIVCGRFGVDAVAPARAVADGLAVGDEYWLCADPVWLQLQQSQVILQPDVQCNAEESASLCADLNRHFAPDGLTFVAADPQRWYIRSSAAGRMSMTPLRAVAGRDVKPHQPQGEDALRWQRLSNEIQMLLHSHPVNQAREERGLHPINSLWLWGGGNPAPLRAEVDVAGGDDGLSALFARAAAVSFADSLDGMLSGNGRKGLWVAGTPSAAWQRADLYAWRDAVAGLEREVVQPLWQAIRQGRLRGLTLDVPSQDAAKRFELSRADSWKLWRRRSPLKAYLK
ncbi:MAG: hypothetical protein AUJ80_01950 [Gallionellaceae bacterium CG1_02_60_325]|nr:MAG: hypothetical protein AUJ80_01950 [Gallionellaceae bacterium CG1_02_60_325]